MQASSSLLLRGRRAKTKCFTLLNVVETPSSNKVVCSRNNCIYDMVAKGAHNVGSPEKNHKCTENESQKTRALSIKS